MSDHHGMRNWGTWHCSRRSQQGAGRLTRREFLGSLSIAAVASTGPASQTAPRQSAPITSDPLAAVKPETLQERDRRMAWWREARFGMFIHFGLFSLPTKEPKRMDRYFSMSMEEFTALKDHFNPQRFDAADWVRAAKEAGMKYLVLVTKSHDGWCLFDSQCTEFDVMATPYRRDILRPLAEACRREGLRICWYYSIMDWHHPEYPAHRSVDKQHKVHADLDRYVVYMKNQLKELLTNYGPVGVLWFDGEWDPCWNNQRGADLERYVRTLQPEIIINNRVGRSRSGMMGLSPAGAPGDFSTPEQGVPKSRPAVTDWETCMTMNNHWQYIDYDQNWKSPTTLIRTLADCASKGGNYLLDVGPQPDGTFPQPTLQRLEAVGRWMRANGESIYGTQAGPLDRPLWGCCTTKRLANGNTRLYLHVFTWPTDGILKVSPVGSTPLGAFLLAEPQRTPLRVAAEGKTLHITLPQQPPDESDSVVVLDVESPVGTGS